MAAAGSLWIVKAAAILTTGVQPPVAYELAQAFIAIGGLGLLGLLGRSKSRLVRTGIVFAALALAGGLGVTIGALGGWSSPDAVSFDLPWSVFYLALAVGGFLGLMAFGVAVVRTRPDVRARFVPALVAFAPAPLLVTGVLHVEIPVLLIGTAWLSLAGWMWTTASTPGGRRLAQAQLG